ncbi:MAG TPA: hypothetical protein VFF72_06120 [Caldimonas sp.]|nr:hypothetical protein [Caldimonas sp.]
MTRRGRIAVLQLSTRLGGPRRRGLYALVAVLVATGAAWLWLHDMRPADSLPSPIEPWMMKLHGAAALLAVYLLGTMLHGHMLNAWHRRQNRISGGVAAAAVLLLAASGYGLYYFGGDALRSATEWLHWVAGFALPPLLWWHIRSGRLAIGGHASSGRARWRRRER